MYRLTPLFICLLFAMNCMAQNVTNTSPNDIGEDDMYNYAKSHNQKQDYEAYLALFPKGKYVDEAKLWLGNEYYRLGNEYYRMRDFDNAKGWYSAYLRLFPKGSHKQELENKMKKVKMNLRAPRFHYLLYAYDKDRPFGGSLGSLSVRKLGFYISIQGNSGGYKSHDEAYHEINNEGVSDYDVYDVVATGNTEISDFCLSVGTNYPISNSFWVYGGLGLNGKTQYDEVNLYSGDNLKDTWVMKNTDESYTTVFPEAGLIFKARKLLVIRYGFMYSKKLTQQIGVGFFFGRD